MNDPFHSLRELWQTPQGKLQCIATATIGLCALAVFISILINFAESRRDGIKHRQRGIVATGTMTGFFIVFYLLLRLQVGVVAIRSAPVRLAMVGVGLTLIVLGCAVNIAGRLRLGRNWADHVTIYEEQRLVTTGVYRWVRHPLYASLIWMFFGASLVYANVAALLANALVFVPFMTYRARLEERLLRQEFPGYAEYQSRVRMFF